MKESITRRRIDEHRKAIEHKKKELAELRTQRDELEDALRHAVGLPDGGGNSRSTVGIMLQLTLSICDST